MGALCGDTRAVQATMRQGRALVVFATYLTLISVCCVRCDELQSADDDVDGK